VTSRRSPFLSPRIWIHLLILRPLLRLLFGVNVDGRENLAGLDRFLIAANHNSHLDILLLFHVLHARQILTTRPVAARDYFGRRRLLFRAVDYLFRPVWIVRGDGEGDPLGEMRRALVSGCNMIIFPEGTRGEPGRITRFRKGIGRLAAEHPEIPTVPIFLAGPERALPKKSSVPLPIWNHVVIGPPQRFQGGPGEITTSLEGMIRELAQSETAGRHRRIRRERRPFTVAVLGIDGSGKSTVSQHVAMDLSQRLRICRISDDVEFYEKHECRRVQWLAAERLRQALCRYTRGARTLNLYKFPKLAELLLRSHLTDEVHRWYAPAAIVLDGAPLINLTAWARIYKGDRFDAAMAAAAIRIATGGDVTREDEVALSALPELAALRRLRLARLSFPDAVVLLDVEPAVAIGRIRGRGDRRQIHETEETLTNLRHGYHMVCDVVRTQFGVPTVIIDGNQEPERLTASVLAFIHDVRGSGKTLERSQG
jgi:1-acyl-sn-glycerol-3-phosphate acyltransferase